MLFGRNTKKVAEPLQQRVDCLIGAETTVTGDVVFSGGLRIDGKITGDVTVSNVKAGTLTLGEHGCIDGDVRVSNLVVFGKIDGSVYVTGLVELRSSARVTGDVYYGSLEMEAGSVIDGRLVKHKAAGEV
jgi:cytoskeletal protein CcmA (bactofilin family)